MPFFVGYVAGVYGFAVYGHATHVTKSLLNRHLLCEPYVLRSHYRTGGIFGIFKKLYDTDADFRDDMSILAERNVHERNPAKGNIKKMYDNFNSNVVVGRGEDPSINKFFDALKSEGYGAIQDINDSKFSGYNAKNPLIIFGQSSNVAVKTFKQLSNDEITKNLAKDGARETAKMLGQQAAMVVPVATLASIPLSDEQVNTIAKTVQKSAAKPTGRKK